MRNKKNIEFVKNNDLVYVSALSGTGKTTLLEDISNAFFDRKIIYLCFNEKMAKESRLRFAGKENVDCFTFHSWAYKNIGYKYNKKLTNKISLSLIKKELFLSANKNGNYIAGAILNIIERFCQSEYFKIKNLFSLQKKSNEYKYSGLKLEALIVLSEIIWSKMCDEKSNMPITHDVYLKIYQLSNNGFPKINYDMILVDEVQDSNALIKNLIVEQNITYKTKTVLVGDKNQNIYGFRGTVDIYKELDLMRDAKELKLNKTYRFGNAIAEVANKILFIKGEDQFLIGNEEIDSKIGVIDNKYQYAIISRTNYGVLGNFLKEGLKGKKIYFKSNINIHINKLFDVLNLKINNRSGIINPEIKKWNSYSKFCKFYKDDIEYSSLIRLINNYKGDFFNDIKIARNNVVDNIEESNIILGTLHSCKGLEFHQVVLGNDYYMPYDKKGDIKKDLNVEELNILYTAITRAKMNLFLNEKYL